MALKLLLLQNAEVEGPGYLLEWAKAAGFSTVICRPFAGEKIPTASSFSHVVLMGTPHSVHDLDSIPWLQTEADWVRALLSGPQRVLGLCFGAQLLAHLLGAQIGMGEHAEIGWHSLEWLPEAAPFGLSGSLSLYQWHQEVFSLPTGAVPIARTAATPLQGFVWRDHVWALGGHPEMNAQLVQDYVNAFWQGKCGFHVQSPEIMLDECSVRLVESRPSIDGFLRAWAGL